MDIRQEIEKLAYELYEKSGRVVGRDLHNWLEAEKIVKARHAGKEIVSSVAEKVEKTIIPAAQKVKDVVKGTVADLKTAASKGLKKGKPG